MKFYADLHIHSHYSIATSKSLIPEYLEYWAKLKGINLIGTGDCVHPGWLDELKDKLEPAGNGLFRLKSEYRLEESLSITGKSIPEDVYFMLTGEISSIYKKNGAVRKVHNLCIFPDFDSVKKVQTQLDRVGNISSDGRPILGLDSKILLEMVLESSQESYLIPAHIWTPWFSVLGAKSGFNSIDECYDDLTEHIFALETGLSSDPAMNWACSFLDRFNLVSNSDAHSPEKLGREANIFENELSYKGVYSSLKNGEGFLGTVEFFPQEGKYHYDGHRKCGIRWDPLQTLQHDAVCSECGKPVTKGVMYRVAELADRDDIENAGNRRDFHSITRLPELIAEVLRVKNSNAKRVKQLFMKLTRRIGSEFYILLDSDIDEIESVGGEMIAEGIRRMRNGDVMVEEGYDGEFGRVRVFRDNELSSFEGSSLFNIQKDLSDLKLNFGLDRLKYSIKFNIDEFRSLKSESAKETEAVKESEADYKSQEPVVFKAEDCQREGIEHFKGPCMIIAGPGSGKTGILYQRIVYLINRKNIVPENILAVTFSNKAAGEIRDRVGQAPPLNLVNITTFHSFGLSILKEHYAQFKRESDFYIIDNMERSESLQSINIYKKAIKSISAEIESYKQGRDTSENIDAVLKQYDDKLIEMNVFDLNDLIFRPVELFRMEPGILEKYREKYKWILVDEFQDINAVQYELIKLLSDKENPNLFVIGDPDQAIYGFRGADTGFIDRIQEDFSPVKIIKLLRSYRCPAPVMKIGSDILKRDDSIRGRPEDMKVEIKEMESARSEADWIASKIENMIGGVRSFSMDSGISDGEAGSSGFSDFSVLCRASFMFEPLIEAFNNHGITYQIISTERFYDREPCRSAIRAMKNVYFSHDNRANIKSNKVSTTNGLDYDINRMIEEGRSVYETLKFILEKEGIDDKLMLMIKKLAVPFNKNFDDFFRSIITRQGIDDYDERAEAVSIMTIHSSKGLEFNTVFIPGCENGIIPFNLFNKLDMKAMAEEERLFYVGVTRTRKNLFLTYSKKRKYKGRFLKQERSPFLDRLEKKLVIFDKRTSRKRSNDGKQLDLF